MKDKKIVVLYLLVLAGLAFSAFQYFTKPKIGFIYNTKVLEKYEGVKDSQKLYRQKEGAFKANIDTLEKELISSIKNYQLEAKGLTDKERLLTEQILSKKQSDLAKYKEAVGAQIRDEDQKLTANVMNQINTYVLKYSKENGYDFILGTSSEGSLFYAADKYDVTEDVVKGLNKEYKGEK